MATHPRTLPESAPAGRSAAADSDPAAGRLRVVFTLQVPPASQDKFIEAYQQIRHQVAQVDGHIADQLCQSTADPSEWMITSEWETPEHFLAWERTAGHRELAAPMIECTTERSSQRYVVRHQTVGAAAAAGAVS